MFFEERRRFKEILLIAVKEWKVRFEMDIAIHFEDGDREIRLLYMSGRGPFLRNIWVTVTFWKGGRAISEFGLLPWELIRIHKLMDKHPGVKVKGFKSIAKQRAEEFLNK